MNSKANRIAEALEQAWSVIAAQVPAVRATTVVARGRVVVIAPHPDDESAAAAGTIALHRKAGDAVTIACATDGNASRMVKHKDQRRGEAERAAKILDAKLEWIGLPEMAWSIDQLSERLEPLIKDADLIYAPSRVDAHPEHFNVAHALALARPLSTIRAYAIYVPLTPVLTNLAIDVSAEADTIEAALAAHESQAHSIQRTLRLRRYAARMHGAERYAETFWELDAASYIALHEAPPKTWTDTKHYFGVRLRAFRDPLAYLAGLRERRALAIRSRRSGR